MYDAKTFKKILNHMGNTSIYVIDRDTHEILFFNDKVKQITPQVELGMICHEVWKSCGNCPLLTIGDKETNQTINYGDPFGDVVDLSATKLTWGPKETPAYLISVTPHTQTVEEQQLELERKKLAVVAKTIYPVIYSVNLTQNRYTTLDFSSSEACLPKEAGVFDQLPLQAAEFVHPDFREEYLKTFNRQRLIEDYKKGKREVGMEYPQLYRDGSYQWVSTRAFFIQDVSNNDILELTLCRNINDQKQAQEKEKKEKQAAYDSMPGGVIKCLADDQFTILEFSRNCQQMLSITEDFQGGGIQFFKSEEKERNAAYCHQRAAEGKPISLEGMVENSDGELCWVHVEGKKTGEQSGIPEYTLVLLDVTKRKKAEQELEQERAKYRIAVENTADVVFEYLPQQDYLVAQENKALGGRTLPIEGFSGKISSLVHKDDLESYRGVLQGRLRKAEIRMIPYGQSDYRWYLLQGDALTERGQVNKVIGTMRDITNPKMSEKNFRSREKLMSATVMTLFGELIILNVKTGKFVSYKTDESVDSLSEYQDFAKFNLEYGRTVIHPEDQEIFFQCFKLENIRANLATGNRQVFLELRRLNAKGEYRWCEMIGTMLQEDNNDYMLLTFRDVHKLHEAKEESRIANQRLAKSVNYFYDAIYEWNLDTNVALIWKKLVQSQKPYRKLNTVQEHFEAMCGGFVHPDYRQTFREICSPEQLKKRFEKGKTEFSMEIIGWASEDRPCWFSVNVQVMRGLDQKTQAMLYLKNIDEQKRKEERRQQALRDALVMAEQANTAKSDFLSRMSHDIRTPMNAIIGMTSIASANLQNPDRVGECLTKIGVSAKFLLSLLNDILDMSKIESGKMNVACEKFDFHEMVQSVTALTYSQASAKNQDFSVFVDDELESSYLGDFLRLSQILMNLLSNAVKYTPEGGRIGLTIVPRRVLPEKTWVHMEVQDNGIGMSDEFQKKIFNVFEQEEQDSGRIFQGSGLGLAIVQNLVHMMGGTITVESARGAGSRFLVDLPLRRTEQSVQKFEELPDEIQVLVADDDAMVCRQTEAILSNMGVAAQWVTSGEQAVECVKESLAIHRPFDIAIIDWKMPGMDGVETVRQIRRAAGPEMMVIVMSAYDWTEIESEARAAGVDLFLSKPIFPKTLYSVLRQAVTMEQKTESLSYQRESVLFHDERVLLVEDSELNREIARTLLEMAGLKVETAENGVEALQKFEASQEKYYGAVLMDIRMPQMDGLEATRRIRGSRHLDGKKIPIIAMTANAFENERREAEQAGMNGYLTKPIDRELMYRTISDVLEKAGDNGAEA